MKTKTRTGHQRATSALDFWIFVTGPVPQISAVSRFTSRLPVNQFLLILVAVTKLLYELTARVCGCVCNDLCVQGASSSSLFFFNLIGSWQ